MLTQRSRKANILETYILSAQRARVASLPVVHGLPDTIDPDKPPKNIRMP
jgi:hypothetical protein